MPWPLTGRYPWAIAFSNNIQENKDGRARCHSAVRPLKAVGTSKADIFNPELSGWSLNLDQLSELNSFITSQFTDFADCHQHRAHLDACSLNIFRRPYSNQYLLSTSASSLNHSPQCMQLLDILSDTS